MERGYKTSEPADAGTVSPPSTDLFDVFPDRLDNDLPSHFQTIIDGCLTGGFFHTGPV